MARDSERFDHALLRRFASYRRVLRQGLSCIGPPDAHVPEPERIDEQLSAAAGSLFREMPPGHRVRVCGRSG